MRQVFEAAVDTLSEADQRVTQIAAVLPLLLRGVSVHRSGLLPLLKELVEILFQARATHYALRTAHCSLLTAHYSLLTTHCSLLTAHCSLLTATYYLLPT